MAITTLDQALAGCVNARMFFKRQAGAQANGRQSTYWMATGFPGAGAYDATLNGATITGPGVAGQLPFTDPTGGQSAYLYKTHMIGSTTATWWICDRLWNNQFDATSSLTQNITSPTWPARDINGSTNGDGLFCAVEVEAQMGAASPAFTLTYTNSFGAGSRTASVQNSNGINQAAIGAMYVFGMSGRDVGIRSIQSIKLSTSWLSGTAHLVVFRPICQLTTVGAGAPFIESDILKNGMQKIYPGSVLYIASIQGGTSTNFCGGTYTVTYG